MTTIPNESIRSLHLCVKSFHGAAKTAKQRGWLVGELSRYAVATRTLAEQVDDDWRAYAREYTVVDDRGVYWAFTSCRTQTATESFLTRRKLSGAPRATPSAAKPELVEPANVGPVLSDEIRDELRELLKWGPSEYVFTAPSEAAIAALVDIAKLEADELDRSRSRRSSDAWGADDLNHITQVQIAAKGLLCDIGDNAGTSPMSMSAADADYISKMLVNGHIRNACWFKRANMAEKALRSATVVNKAKMDDATAALAQRMVDLMNAAVQSLGYPVSFAEYVEIMTSEAA